MPDNGYDGPLDTLSPRMRYVRRWFELKAQRAPFEAAWDEIARFVVPRRIRRNAGDRAWAGRKVEFEIINSHPTLAVEVNAAGMHASLTDPGHPWYRLSPQDPRLADVDAVRSCLGEWEDTGYRIMAGSNLYDRLHEVYLDVAPFGNSCIFIEEDLRTVVRAYVLPIGSYCIATNARGEVDTLYRCLQMSLSQLVEEFGFEKCSRGVQEAFKHGRRDDWRTVLHVVEPNPKHIPGRMGPAGWAFKSCWMEFPAGGQYMGQAADGSYANDANEGYLREGGYHEKPFAVARYSTTGEDVWGYGPGATAIGDCKTLQLLERDALRFTALLAQPPLVGPVTMRGEPVDLNPGGMNYEDEGGAGKGFRPLVELPAQGLAAISAEIQRVDKRVGQMFHEDLWQLISQIAQGGREVTAFQTNELKAEKMLQLGPTVQRFQHEVLRVIIERVYAIAHRRRLLSKPPKELQGQNLKIQYESLFAQAQRMSRIQAIRELVGATGEAAKLNPEAIDNVDFDQALRDYADALGVEPAMLRSREVVQQVRQQRAQAQQAQAQAEQQQVQAQTAQTLSDTNTTDDNALTRIMQANGLR
jgi:hypothetical protein